MSITQDPLFPLLLNEYDLFLQLDRKGFVRQVVIREGEPLTIDARRSYSTYLRGKNIQRFFRLPPAKELPALALRMASRADLLSPRRLFDHGCSYPSLNAFERYDAFYAYFSTLPFSRLYLRHFEGVGFFGLVRFAQVDSLCNPHRHTPVVVLDEAGLIKGVNRAFLGAFGDERLPPGRFLERPAGEFLSSTPLERQTGDDRDFFSAREGAWKEAAYADLSASGAERISKVMDLRSLRQERGGWVFDAPADGVKALRFLPAADESKTDLRIEVELQLLAGELPSFILNGAKQTKDFPPDTDGYLAGPDVEGRFFQIKKEGELIHRTPMTVSRSPGAYRIEMVRVGPAIAYFVNGRLALGYRDSDPNRSPLSVQYLFCRLGGKALLKSVRISLRPGNTGDFSFQEVSLLNGRENTYRFQTFIDRNRLLRRDEKLYYAYILNDITLLKRNITVLSRDLDRYKALALGPVAAGPLVLGESAALLKIKRDALRTARSSATVLLEGETGTGKEVLAHFIHANSGFKTGPFVKVDCASIPESLIESELFGVEKGAFTGAGESRPGKLEAAAGGTLFLDEVENLKSETQAKLLGFLQDFSLTRLGSTEARRVETRIVAAANQPLHRLVAQERFRSDLYFRLNAVKLTLPPLRERREDISALALHFLKVFNEKFGRSIQGLTAEALRRLSVHAWPGNIRELENAVQKAVLFCDGDRIEPRHLELSAPPSPGAGEADGFIPRGDARALKKEHIEALLAKHNGIIERAARDADVSRTTFYRKMQIFGVAG